MRSIESGRDVERSGGSIGLRTSAAAHRPAPPPRRRGQLGPVRSSQPPATGVLGILCGHLAVFREWTEINGIEGHFLEQILPGALARTIKEDRGAIRCLFQHGRDPNIGSKVLGPITALEEDDYGARYEVELLDTAFARQLQPGLERDVYSASFRFTVTREEVDDRPQRSEHNPQRLPERRVAEVKLREFGPVTFGAYAGASAGMRSRGALSTPADLDRLQQRRAPWRIRPSRSPRRRTL